MHKYRLISKKGEGTFSEVLKAQSIKSNKYLAIKCMKNHFDSIDQVNNLREIQALRRLSPHPGIIKLYEVLYDQPTGRLALVFELMDMNIYEMIRGRRHYLPEARVKMYMYQLLKSMDHMHRNGIFHRDIKPENILVSEDVLKVADFGSCRGIYSKQPYTEYISTRWYRAPECLLTDGYYGYKMDLWGVGCVMFEIIALFPLFPGTNELDQIERIHNILGTPSKEVLAKFKKYATHMEFNFAEKAGSGIAKMVPHAGESCIDLISKLLAYDPENRLSARQALRHPYFSELRQADKQRERAAAKAAQASDSGSTAPAPSAAPGAAVTVSPAPAGSLAPSSSAKPSYSSSTPEAPLKGSLKSKEAKKKKAKDGHSSPVSTNSPLSPAAPVKKGGAALPMIAPQSTSKQSLPNISKTGQEGRTGYPRAADGAYHAGNNNQTYSSSSNAASQQQYQQHRPTQQPHQQPFVDSMYRKAAKQQQQQQQQQQAQRYGDADVNHREKKQVSHESSNYDAKGSKSRGYYEYENAVATKPVAAKTSYKVKYQSPYSQKFIARQRVLS